MTNRWRTGCRRTLFTHKLLFVHVAILAFIQILAIPISLEAEELIYNFDRFAQKQGLSQGQVFDIKQDVNGRIWVATYSAGITIIDGNKETYLTKADGLPGSSTTSLYRDYQNNMWIGTNKGVCYYDGYSIKTPSTIQNNETLSVWDIEEDSNHTIWLATDQGIWFVRNDTIRPYNQELIQYPFYHISKQPSEKQLWFLSGVVGIYSLENHVIKEQDINLSNDIIVEVIYFINDNHLLLGTTTGLIEIKRENEEASIIKKTLKNKHVVSIAFDSDNQLWAGTDEDGLFIFDKAGDIKQITAYQGIGHNRIYSLFKDENENMWVGTDGAGVSLFKGFQFSELRIDELHQPSFITALHIDKKGNLWGGTENQGIVRLSKNGIKHHNTTNGLIDNNVRSVTSDDYGKVYIATNNGITIINNHNKSYLRKPKDLVTNLIEHLLIDYKGRLWAGSFGHGVQCVTDQKLFSSANGLTGDYIWDIFESSDNKLYIGTDEGVTIIENDRIIDTINIEDGLLNQAVSDITEDRFGNIWIAAEEGLYCYNKEKSKYYPLEKLGNSNIIYSVITDLFNHVLIGTENGIIVLNTDEEGNIISTKRYSKNEGFFGIECNANAVTIDKTGNIYWGTTQGITKQIAAQNWHTQMVSSPRITAIEISEKQGEVYKYADSITPYSLLPINLKLPHNKNNITIQIGSSELFHKEKMRFRYKLEGLDKEWSVPGTQTHINYNHLSPGVYTFAVQSLHADFPQLEADTSYYTFKINTPIYSTWWFRIIIFVTGTSIILLLWNYRIYALRRRKITLQKLVRERTSQLSEQKNALEKANREIRQSAELKEEFLANTSHEMRTPLNVVIGFSNLLLNENLTILQKKYTENIRHSGEHLKVIIGDLLDLSVIEANKLKMVNKPFNYRRVIINTFNMLKSGGEIKGLKMSLNIGKPANNVIGDAVRLTQIVSNLLRNAIKFTENGFVEIKTYETPIDNTTTQLHILIKDSGIGIPENKFGQIFKSFTQVTGKLTRKYGGAGLGLSIVKKLVDLHNGSINLASTNGEGSIFHVTLKYEISQSAERSLVKNTKIEKDHALAGKKILIVDDNEINLSLAIETLTQYNTSIITEVAYNGIEACKLVDKNSYDLVIMDIQMPEMNGYEATTQIRKRRDEKAKIPILGMTAHAMKDERKKCIDIGMNDYLSKPFSPNTLLHKIKSLLQIDATEEVGHNPNGQPNIPMFKHLDIQKIKAIVGDSLEKEQKYLKMLQQTVPVTMQKMTDGIAQENLQQIKVTAHSLKSTFRYYGADKLTQLCLEIEKQATEIQFESIPNLAIEVLEQWKKIEQELDVYFKNS